jgi:ABC transporter substrate binding protein
MARTARRDRARREARRVRLRRGGLRLDGRRILWRDRAAAATHGIELLPIRISAGTTAADIEAAVGKFAAEGGGGLIAAADGGANLHRSTVISQAAQHRLPAVYPFRYYAEEGGLAVYGVNVPENYRRAGGYVDRILKGAKPADLPVQAPDKFELIINLRTANALGIVIPPLLLTRADEVIRCNDANSSRSSAARRRRGRSRRARSRQGKIWRISMLDTASREADDPTSLRAMRCSAG